MNHVIVATSDRDAAAVAAVEQHHAEMAGALAVKVEALVSAAARQDALACASATDELVAWCEHELGPHALAEEKAMYPSAHGMVEGRLLVTGMLAEHGVIVGLVGAVAKAPNAVRAAAAATALLTMFLSHLSKENELVLPLLAADPAVSVNELLGGMHELLGGGQTDEPAHSHGFGDEAASGCGGHRCACGDLARAGTT